MHSILETYINGNIKDSAKAIAKNNIYAVDLCDFLEENPQYALSTREALILLEMANDYREH
jgi:hypothetical protein